MLFGLKSIHANLAAEGTDSDVKTQDDLRATVLRSHGRTRSRDITRDLGRAALSTLLIAYSVLTSTLSHPAPLH